MQSTENKTNKYRLSYRTVVSNSLITKRRPPVIAVIVLALYLHTYLYTYEYTIGI